MLWLFETFTDESTLLRPIVVVAEFRIVSCRNYRSLGNSNFLQMP